MKTILVIDDSDDFRQIISTILLDHDYDVWEAACPDDAYEILKRETFDLILCDLNMPFTLGEEFHNYPFSHEVGVKTIQELGWVYPTKPIIAMSAASPHDLEKWTAELGDLPLLNKPFPPTDLLRTIEQSLSVRCGETVH